jgi:hypothetical protein
MNRKQKVLTIIALIAFVVIGVGHYLNPGYRVVNRGAYQQVESTVLIPDVRMPWFMLGVIYAGLFFLLADRKEKR